MQTPFWPGFTTEVLEDVEFIDGGIELDPNWKFVDAQGHGHFVSTGGLLPTLTKVDDGCGDEDHDEDCTGGNHYECSHCGEVIAPRVRERGMQVIPRLPTYVMRTIEILNGFRIDREYRFRGDKGEELTAGFHEVIKRVLANHLVEEKGESIG